MGLDQARDEGAVFGAIWTEQRAAHEAFVAPLRVVSVYTQMIPRASGTGSHASMAATFSLVKRSLLNTLE